MPSPAGRMGARAGIILRATTTMEVVPVELIGALVVPPAELGRDCGGEWGRDGGEVADTLSTVRGDPIAPARMRRECACSCSRMNPRRRFRRTHLPRLTAHNVGQHATSTVNQKTEKRKHALRISSGPIPAGSTRSGGSPSSSAYSSASKA